MEITWDEAKESQNRTKHKLSFSLAEAIFNDPLVAIVYDRHEGGEHRYHAVGIVEGKCLVVVHTYPDVEDQERVRVIGMREATPPERRRYEEGDSQ